jgi:ribonuclease D
MNLADYRYHGAIHLITEADMVLQAIETLITSSTLGFDTETRPAFKKGESYLPALLQLATPDECFIFRLHQTGLTRDLRDLLADEQIKKVGVAIRDDLVGLRKIKTFTPRGFIELADLARQQGFQKLGLRNLSAELLGLNVSKKLRTTNWERKELTEAQLRYAAGDADLSLRLLNKLSL